MSQPPGKVVADTPSSRKDVPSATSPRRVSAHESLQGTDNTPCCCRHLRVPIHARLDFAQTWTPFEQARNSGRAEALALLDSMLAARPHAAPLAELEVRSSG